MSKQFRARKSVERNLVVSKLDSLPEPEHSYDELIFP